MFQFVSTKTMHIFLDIVCNILHTYIQAITNRRDEMSTFSITRKEANKLFQFCKENSLKEFFIAKDQGAYIGATAGSQSEGNFRNSIHYIDGCNPEKDEDFYANARDRFGGDDFGEHLPVMWLNAFLKHPSFQKKRKFSIRLTNTSIKLVL